MEKQGRGTNERTVIKEQMLKQGGDKCINRDKNKCTDNEEEQISQCFGLFCLFAKLDQWI